MYEVFFQLSKAPFSLVPDADCVYLTSQQADVISGLTLGVLDRKGYIVLTGEAGLGKTTALRALAGILSKSSVQGSMIFIPTLTGPEFLELVMLNFGFKEIPKSKAQRIHRLEQFLLHADQQDKVSALIIDEAQQLSPELLEEIRLLGNFERRDRKLLQIVLVGQEQFVNRLNHPDLWQLKQRVAMRLSLERLGRNDVEEYIRFRWSKAGGAPENLPFTADAIDGVASWSFGIPRLINAICDNALLIAFACTKHEVGLFEVREACVELDLRVPSFNRAAQELAAAETEAEDRDEAAQFDSPTSPGAEAGVPALESWSGTLDKLAHKIQARFHWAS
jgi:general secretion pathway protein A